MTSLNGNGDFEKRPHPWRYALLATDGRVVATNSNAGYLAGLAERLWPDQEQDPDRTGAGWDVEVVR